MKFTSLILVGSIFAVVPAFAAEQTKPAAAKDTAAAKPAAGADAAWAEIEPLLNGPKERPTTQDEAKAVYKKHLEALDEKGAAFIKAYPNDPRRWKLAMHELQANRVRTFVGMAPKNEAEMGKLLADILAAPDADKETKGFASFTQVMEAQGKDSFQQLAEAHVKAYPDFKGNRQIEGELKRAEAEKELKTKPIDLKFTAVDGTQVDLAKMRGKVVLVDFWAMWCGPCVAEIPNVVTAYNKLHDKGFEIVGISFDNDGDKEKLGKFTKEKGMTWVQFFDGKGWKNEFGQKYGINSIPRMWLVDKKGMVVDTNARAGLAGKVEKLLAE